MSQAFRLAEGGLIDRSRSLSFRFDGKGYTGHPGDTLASALLANGIHLVGRSFKYHRPRGIFSAGAEEPNALVTLDEGERSEPNARATLVELFDGLSAQAQHCWPRLEFDIGRLNDSLGRFFPAGFYYKTFMWPPRTWPLYEHFIRRAAGLGRIDAAHDKARYDKTHAHCDLLVVGAGPAGIAAALAAGRAGARVILAEQDSRPGGSLLSMRHEQIDGKPSLAWLESALAELERLPEVQILTRTVAYGAFDHNYYGLVERVTNHLPNPPRTLPRERLWRVRARQVVLASGAIERPLVFAGNDRPGVMLASACRSYLNRFAVKPGTRAVILVNNDLGYPLALDMKDAGIEVAAIVDLRPEPDGHYSDAAEIAGLPVVPGRAVLATEGDQRISAVRIGRLSDDGTAVDGGLETVKCDLLAVSGGWSPTVHLFSQGRGKLAFDERLACFRPDKPWPGQAVVAAGAANGDFGLGAALAGGHAAGLAAAGAGGFEAGTGEAGAGEAPRAESAGPLPARWIWRLPREDARGGKAFVDLQNDVTADDLALALREGYRSIEHVKRYTTTGMGTDQGKTANVNAIGIVAEALGRPLPEVGVTTFRPPYTPVTFGAFAGRDVDALLQPVRRTALHAWHEQAGAAFEDVGQWHRAWYYPKPGEGLHEAVNREVAACRSSVGMLDASTLGKIDIQGRDAAEFLNRIYTNAWSKLGVGRCRYGLMLKEDGMVFDDGVTSRLGDHHYLMTTTSGNAAAVLAHMEEWLQCEWPELEVYMTSLTEQFATVSIAGPNARALLGELSEIDLSNEAFPHMSLIETKVAGLAARVFRISFTGETAFEINVPAGHGLALWQSLMTAGAKYGITPYGTEAMHVLRAEKGFIIVGQETDGSVTPIDLGMEWIVSKTKDFIGKRSLARADMKKPDRKQLVGLLTEDPKAVLPEGAQLVEEPRDKPPMPMVGHVTSSYYSPNLERSIALALIKGGRARIGQRLVAPLLDGRQPAAKVVQPVFFDPEGARLNA